MTNISATVPEKSFIS